MKIPPEEFSDYKELFEQELYCILDYWLRNALDSKEKGFFGAVDLNNNPVLSANKSCVLNSRILWTFSSAAYQYGKKEYAEFADIAYRIVSTFFYDEVNGGYFMELNPDNEVADDTKHTYSNAFVLYSLCKYYEYNPSENIMNKITSLFNLIEEKTKDAQNLGYFESFTRDWKLNTKNRMADNNEPKSMNTHLHILEAYSSLYEIHKNITVKNRLIELVEIFINKIIRSNGHLGIFFNDVFEEVEATKGICSVGHDIESTWLLWKASEILSENDLKDLIKPLIFKIIDAVKREGVDSDGGLYLESSRFGSHLRTNKHWWLQAENLVGFMNAYQISLNNEYWSIVKQTWNFINKYVIDHDKGEWYTKVNRLGTPYLIEPEDDPSPYYRNDWKIDPWKCPYHSGRAMMELIKRIKIILGTE